MIFYLTPPHVRIDLPSFNECCFSRFKFFLEIAAENDCETAIEKLIPGTKLDEIGHFLLRSFSVFYPDVKDFVVAQEVKLFMHRLTLPWRDKKKSCRNILKQLPKLNHYKIFNPIKRCTERPQAGILLCSTLSNLCNTLLNPSIGLHVKTQCDVRCTRYHVEVPFQMCLTLIKDRSVVLNRGFALIPCSVWNFLLVELFRHHYEFGMSMISNTILPHLCSDVRWTTVFCQLRNTFDMFKQRRPLLPSTCLTARQIDDEKQYFPPCMAHLLKMLRTHHRLSHHWRYNLSLFLKDLGLSVEESIEFWRTEYSKSCTAESSCTHSWQANCRKYIYSIRHLYGLEGSRLKKKSKSCRAYQNMALGMREEGGCPFTHFDDANFLSSLTAEVAQNTAIVDKILELRTKDPSNACSVYRAACVKTRGLENSLEEFTSPLNYYRSLKQCANLNSSLDW